MRAALTGIARSRGTLLAARDPLTRLARAFEASPRGHDATGSWSELSQIASLGPVAVEAGGLFSLTNDAGAGIVGSFGARR